MLCVPLVWNCSGSTPTRQSKITNARRELNFIWRGSRFASRSAWSGHSQARCHWHVYVQPRNPQLKGRLEWLHRINQLQFINLWPIRMMLLYIQSLEQGKAPIISINLIYPSVEDFIRGHEVSFAIGSKISHRVRRKIKWRRAGRLIYKNVGGA